MTGAHVHLTALHKTYAAGGEQPLRALDDVTLTVAPGTMLAVTGPSGSGKSTLLHAIGAMDTPDSGTVRVDDSEVTTLTGKGQARYRRSIGFVFQRFHLLPALTVLDNVIAPVLPYRTRFNKAARGRELLAAVGLADRGATVPGRLSGGQQQRVAIARALINRPRLLLADEPTGNLDSTTGQEILTLIERLRAEYGMTVLIATHDPVAASHCDRIIALRDGRLVDDLTVPAGSDGRALLDQITRADPHA